MNTTIETFEIIDTYVSEIESWKEWVDYMEDCKSDPWGNVNV